MHRTPHSYQRPAAWALGIAAAVAASGCSSGGSVYVPPPIVAAPPAPPPPPASPPERPAESPTGGSGPEGGGGGSSPYTGSMTAYELLARSAIAYGEADAYLDEGSIIIDQPSRRQEYGFTTSYTIDGEFAFTVRGSAGSTFPEFGIRKAGRRFETMRTGSYGQAATLEEAIKPLQDIMTPFTTNVPRLLAGEHWGPTTEYDTARILGVTSVNGQPTIMLELDLVAQGPATVWLDQATLLIRRLAHQSPRSQTFVTVNFSRLEAR